MIITREQIDSLLSKVRRPSRYIDGEVNSVHKDWDGAKVKWCLAFPDVYEVGMSHIGLGIIYDILNACDDTLADRVFTPWTDMESAMRAENVPLWGLESKRSLSEFDIIGITLPYELTYTNILTMLNLAGIPFYAKDRDASHPLIIGGGVGAFNPEPVADLFDAIILGDGEEVVLEISKIVKDLANKPNILCALSKIRGIYVPSIHDGSAKVYKAIVSDIDAAEYPKAPVVPFMKVIHDRVGIEIQRGCARGCRFCQAGYIYRPVRQRSISRLEELSNCQLQSTGNEDLSFLSLSAGDYEPLPELMKNVAAAHEESWINMNLPSLRVESLTPDILSVMQRTLKGGFTLAPEAATDRLRRVINKGNTEEELLFTIDKIFGIGWRQLKLYFMIGLPTETVDDVKAIAELSHKAYDIGRRYRRDITITVSVSTFIPKPHTPFQWAGQISIAETKQKQDILKGLLRRRGIELKWHHADISFLEGVFSRGDRSLLKVIVNAWNAGARLDAWDEEFKYDVWMTAFKDAGIDPSEYLKPKSLEEKLPWGHLFADIDPEFLKKEYELALQGEITHDCVNGKCSKCGVCDFEDVKNVICPCEQGRSDFPREIASPPSEVRNDVLLNFTFTKEDNAKWLSHLELMQVLRRAFRRAGIPTKYSQGFHPHMKLSLERALKVGEASQSEKGKIELSGNLSPQILIEGLNKHLPDGIKIISMA